MPHDTIVRKQWVHQISRHQKFDDAPISYPVCILHFDTDKIIQRGKRTTLVKGTVPTKFPE